MLKRIAYLRVVGTFLWTCTPAIVSFVIFMCFSLAGGQLNPGLAFTVLAVVNNLRGRDK